MTIEELTKALSGLNLPKKRLNITDPVYGKDNVLWLLRNLLIWNKGDIAEKCYKELKSLIK